MELDERNSLKYCQTKHPPNSSNGKLTGSPQVTQTPKRWNQRGTYQRQGSSGCEDVSQDSSSDGSDLDEDLYGSGPPEELLGGWSPQVTGAGTESRNSPRSREGRSTSLYNPGRSYPYNPPPSERTFFNNNSPSGEITYHNKCHPSPSASGYSFSPPMSERSCHYTSPPSERNYPNSPPSEKMHPAPRGRISNRSNSPPSERNPHNSSPSQRPSSISSSCTKQERSNTTQSALVNGTSYDPLLNYERSSSNDTNSPPELSASRREELSGAICDIDYSNVKIKGFETSASRLTTFELYDRETPRREDLAECGFIFIEDDVCQCVSCEVILCKWLVDDDVWREHEKYSPNCEFVRHHQRQTGAGPAVVEPTIRQYKEVVARLDTDMVRYVIQLGYPEDDVGSVIQEKLMKGEEEFTSLTALVEEMEDIRTEKREPPRLRFHRRRNSVQRSIEAAKQTTLTKEMTSHSESSAPVPEVEIHNSGDLREVIEENEELEDRQTCSICIDADRDTVFIPCQHFVTCSGCASRLKNCPICRVTIQNKLIVVTE